MPGSHSDDSCAEVTVTEAAKGHLAAQLELVSGRDACFRLRTGSDQKMATAVTEPSPGDTLVRHGNKVVLAIAPDLAERLQGSTIDIEHTDDGRKALIVL